MKFGKQMFRKLSVLLLLAFCLPLAASAATEVNSTVSSGGQVSGALHTIGGQSAAGVVTNTVTTVEIGGLYLLLPRVVEVPGVPAGTVPLSIARDGNDIRISWEAAISNPQIFVLTGAGSGEYVNDDRGWVPITDDSVAAEFEDYSADNYVLHQNQVGAVSTHPEAYYRALQAGVGRRATNPDTGTSNLVAAGAVGKVDVVIYGNAKYNMVGVPLIQSVTNIDDVLSQALRQNDIEIMKFDNKNQEYQGTYFKDGSWAEPLIISVSQGDAVWVYNPTADDIVITMVGKVPLVSQDISRIIYGEGKYNMLTLPHVQGGTQEGIGLTAIPGSEIMIFDNLNQQYSGAYVEAGAWNSSLNIYPGAGFWYYKTGEDDPWITRTH